MPKATSAIKDPNALKRNQACHQCRRRKLKCDAGHPCTTCVRSHAFATRSAQSAASSANPVVIPPLECTYDDSTSDFWQESSQAKFDRLENKIASLEALLRESTERIQVQEQQLGQLPNSPPVPVSSPVVVSNGMSGGATPSSASSPLFTQGTLAVPTASPSTLLRSPSTQTAIDSTASTGSSPVPSTLEINSSSTKATSTVSSSSRASNSYFKSGSMADYLQQAGIPPYITPEDQACTVHAMDAIGTLDGSYDPYATTIKFQSTDPDYSFGQPFSSRQYPTQLPKISPMSLAEYGIDDSSLSAEAGLGVEMLDAINNLSASDLSILPHAWPQFLPPPELLLHLVDTFFTCHPHAGRILHRGAFMNSLTYPPNHPQFPLPALLHAICAVASFYTAVVDPPEMPAIDDMEPEAIFYDPKVPKPKKNPSFGETHAMWSTLSAARAIQSGERMLQVVQSTIILAWFQYTSGSSVNVWILVGKACRITAPLGISVSQAFGTLSRFNRMPALIPPPKTTIDAEQRRNLFWLIYATERFHTAGTCWSMLLDDEDISQFLPVGDSDFNAGKEVPERIRQRLGTTNVLLTHPPEVTSSFSLFIKSAVLLSKVKVFNVRFRTKYADLHGNIDPRNTAEFQELDKLLSEFKGSWPREFKDPISLDGKVDPTLYLASIVPFAAIILLHDPHANFNSPQCPSAQRMTEAAAGTMESIYQLCSTSFDVLLLDHVTSFCWFVAGACLIRVLKAKMTMGSTVEMIKYNSDIDVIRMMLLRLGERTIIGRRQIKLLNEHYAAEISGPNQAYMRMFGSLTRKEGAKAFTTPSQRIMNSLILHQPLVDSMPPRTEAIMSMQPREASQMIETTANASTMFIAPTRGSIGAMLRSCLPGSTSPLAFPQEASATPTSDGSTPASSSSPGSISGSPALMGIIGNSGVEGSW